MYPTPAPPTITGPNEACNSATLVAVPGDHGNGIQWIDNSSTANARTVTATSTLSVISTSLYGCKSSSRTFTCTINNSPATQTLVASAAGYCEGSATVRLALSRTQSGATYQLYRDNAPVSGATLTGTGSAATFSGAFAAGVYQAEASASAQCPAVRSNNITVSMYPTPAPPTITGPNEACNSATLVAVPGDHGNGIQWTDNSSTANARTITATATLSVIST